MKAVTLLLENFLRRSRWNETAQDGFLTQERLKSRKTIISTKAPLYVKQFSAVILRFSVWSVIKS